ncbi:MAG: hypothetical protein MI919_30810, partial [Holophagales bacterium]|nr:hypothetical protein [Holophagales bacterium]
PEKGIGKGILPPMDIDVRNAVPGRGVHLEVLRDCDGDRRPDRLGTGSCRSPLGAWTSPPADETGSIHTELDFAKQGWKLPENVGLWLRVSRSPDGIGTLAPFGLMRNACDLWGTLVDTFFGGDCEPGLQRALRKHRTLDGLEDITFEARRIVVSATDPSGTVQAAEPVSVPGTLGATGVAWADESTLLVTRAPVVLELPAVLPSQEKASTVPPGLYRIDLSAPEDAEPELLWKPDDDSIMPAAPFALPGGRIAFVRQSLLGNPLAPEESDPVLLSFWKDGSLEPVEIPLPFRIYRILAVSEKGDELLALTAGVRSKRPLLLRVHLDDGTVDAVGFHQKLYGAALRSPDGKMSAISMLDASGRWGWELLLVDRAGDWVADLAHRKKLHDLMPAWRPNRWELAFLAEVSRIERRIR